MKNILLFTVATLFIFSFYACPYSSPKRQFPNAYFPDTITNMSSLNSVYDDINMALMIKFSSNLILFSSNRNSEGKQFDIVGDKVSFLWHETSGDLATDDTDGQSLKYLQYLLTKTQTEADEYGPYGTIYNDDLYLFYANNSEGTNNMYLLIYRECMDHYYDQVIADELIEGPFKIPSLSNPNSNEAYLSFHTNKMPADDFNRFNTASDSINLIFCSDSLGQYDIYSLPLTGTEFSKEVFTATIPHKKQLLSTINSEYNDRCPNVCGNFMVFSSDRPGGLGGYDFYYSIFENGSWSEAINFGAPINSAYDEYRALAIKAWQYENDLLIFSSNRPGGIGGFDIYYTGIDEMPAAIWE
ncbi:MAG: hypothetical protein ACERKD_14935 [Prolixibacteraceae bacterium]